MPSIEAISDAVSYVQSGCINVYSVSEKYNVSLMSGKVYEGQLYTRGVIKGGLSRTYGITI